jgi:prepilin-type N-terminal cleavage/methylation domain-containing protein
MCCTARDEAGFSVIEVLAALSIFAVAVVPMLYVAAAAQRLVRSQSDATDLQQRARIAAERLQRDLALAGAGPPHARSVGSLVNYLPPLVPARTGLRLADAEMSAFGDRISIVYVPEDGWEAPLSAALTDTAAPVPIDAAGVGCGDAGLCGFVESSRAMIVDVSGPGAGHDVFTVTGLGAGLEHASPNAPLSRVYTASTSHVVPIVQRVYYFDRAGRRLMVYDGYQSDVPFIDNVVDVRFEYFVDASPGPGLRPIALSDLANGPMLGAARNRFDADLRSIRLVRAVLRLQAAADELRGTGGLFLRAGRSSSGFSFLPDIEMTFEAAPRNMRLNHTSVP